VPALLPWFCSAVPYAQLCASLPTNTPTVPAARVACTVCTALYATDFISGLSASRCDKRTFYQCHALPRFSRSPGASGGIEVGRASINMAGGLAGAGVSGLRCGLGFAACYRSRSHGGLQRSAANAGSWVVQVLWQTTQSRSKGAAPRLRLVRRMHTAEASRTTVPCRRCITIKYRSQCRYLHSRRNSLLVLRLRTLPPSSQITQITSPSTSTNKRELRLASHISWRVSEYHAA